MAIDLETFNSLADIELKTFAAKPSSIEGDQVEASQALWSSPDGSVEVGIWECTPGRFQTHRETSSELCHFISGKVEMRDLEGNVRILGPGDMLLLPKGWKGEWRLLERTRKLYLTTI